MKVLMVEPGFAPYEAEINGLREMQQAVGGLIQAIYPFEELVGVICNEEGLINGLPFNRSMPGGYEGVFGNFFVCGLGEEDFCSLTPEQMQKDKKVFHNAEILLGASRKGLVIVKAEPHIKGKKPAEKRRDAPPGRE